MTARRTVIARAMTRAAPKPDASIIIASLLKALRRN
jgi:hypothetical protein